MITLILAVAVIAFIYFIVTNVSREYKVLKLDSKAQQSYRKREQQIIEKELLSSLIDREIDAQNSLDRSFDRFRALPPEVQEKIIRRISANRRESSRRRD